MISINVGGNRPGPSPCFPEHVDTQAEGGLEERSVFLCARKKTKKKQGGNKGVLSCRMASGGWWGGGKLHLTLNECAQVLMDFL